MDSAQIEKWARESGFCAGEFGLVAGLICDLTRFAELVAAQENERCAVVCDNVASDPGRTQIEQRTAGKLAAAIRKVTP